jgi:hypothetical protein
MGLHSRSRQTIADGDALLAIDRTVGSRPAIIGIIEKGEETNLAAVELGPSALALGAGLGDRLKGDGVFAQAGDQMAAVYALRNSYW